MTPQTLTERLIRTAQTADPDTAADEYATAAAQLRTADVYALAAVLRILATEVGAARDADMEDQASRRRLA